MEENPYKAPSDDAPAIPPAGSKGSSAIRWLALGGLGWFFCAVHIAGGNGSWSMLAEWIVFGTIAIIAAIKVFRRA